MDNSGRALRMRSLNCVKESSTLVHIPPSPIMKCIGYGTGVNVYRLERGQQGSPWALKKVSQSKHIKGKELFSGRIHREAEILRSLNHPNIVGFRGLLSSVDGADSLALECCTTSLGSILEERFDADTGPLPAIRIWKIINDIGHAMDYLHREMRLLHGDIKSFNILVKGDFETCKLCDFGVSLKLDVNGMIDFSKEPDNVYVGTTLWAAPEIINEVDVIDCSADVFSFGLVLYETIALVPPHTLNISSEPSVESETLNDTTPVEDTEALATSDHLYGTRPPLPHAFQLNSEYNSIIELFYLCTNEMPEDRPSAEVLCKSFLENEAAKLAVGMEKSFTISQ